MMSRLSLMEPHCVVAEEYCAYLAALRLAGENSNINYGSKLREVADDFPAFVHWFAGLRRGEDLPATCRAQYVYWLVRDGREVVGESQLTHHTDGRFTAGYVIHPRERRQGYGTRLLALTLAQAYAHGADHVLVSCRTTNTASARIIRQNGGTLCEEAISPHSGKLVSHYRIALDALPPPQHDTPLAATADTAQIQQAIWENMFAHYLSFGSVPGGTSSATPQLKWAYAGKPLLFNRIFGARFAQHEAVERVQQMTALAATWGSRVCWLIDPASTPADLPSMLLENGWRNPRGEDQPLLSWPGMALPLATLADAIAIPPGVTFARVDDDAGLCAWLHGFFSQTPPAMLADIQAVYRALGYGKHLPWALYTAYLHGEPVASSLVYCGAGVAGVYWVGTTPSARRQGIGTAITWYALRQAAVMGYHWAILQASEMGAPVYRQLGFQEYGAVLCLVYQP